MDGEAEGGTAQAASQQRARRGVRSEVSVQVIDTAGARLQVILGSGLGGTPTQGPIVPVPGIGRIVDVEIGRTDGGPMDDVILLDDAGGVTVMLGGVAGTLNPAPAGRTVLASGGTAASNFQGASAPFLRVVPR